MPLTESVNLVLRNKWAPMDPDAAAYITAVEAADTAAGQSGGLEEKTKIAIDNFVLGCKADGIWSAIKASCILAGARTLAGALVPLVGTAPTNFNFVSGDYNRKTGLIGNGTSKYLNSNRNNNADPQDNQHLSVYVSEIGTNVNQRYIGAGGSATGSSVLSRATSGNIGAFRSRNSTANNSNLTLFNAHLLALSRSSPNSYVARCRQIPFSFVQDSQTSFDGSITVFQADGFYATDRLAFYSIGESLDLTKLDARVTALINAFGAAIP